MLTGISLNMIVVSLLEFVAGLRTVVIGLEMTVIGLKIFGTTLETSDCLKLVVIVFRIVVTGLKKSKHDFPAYSRMISCCQTLFPWLFLPPLP